MGGAGGEPPIDGIARAEKKVERMMEWIYTYLPAINDVDRQVYVWVLSLCVSICKFVVL